MLTGYKFIIFWISKEKCSFKVVSLLPLKEHFCFFCIFFFRNCWINLKQPLYHYYNWLLFMPFWVILSVEDLKISVYFFNDLHFLHRRHKIIWNGFNELWQNIFKFVYSHGYFSPIAPTPHPIHRPRYHGDVNKLEGIVFTLKKHIVYLNSWIIRSVQRLFWRSSF